MLILPQELMVREPDPASWQNLGAEAFNGRAENTFGQTTLHLSFTNYKLSLYDGVVGTQDSQVHFVESVVSVYDCGIWVGDIDILGAMGRTWRLPPQHLCEHERDTKPCRELISLESWDEILDPPKASSVVRANGNWPARLAIIALLVARNSKDDKSTLVTTTRITVCPRSVCWKCLDHELQLEPTEPADRPTSQYFVY